MKYNPITRRHFLQGMRNSALSLPFLPSLMPSKAFAVDINGPKFFFFIGSPHGGLDRQNVVPTVAPRNSATLYSAENHDIRWDSLADMTQAPLIPSLSTRTAEFGENELSPVLGNFFNPILDKINFLEGIDLIFATGHHQAHLGNFHGHDGASNRSLGFDGRLDLPPMSSIDQVMAASPNFYLPDEILAQPVSNLSRFSYKVLNNNQSVRVPSAGSPQNLFAYYFGIGSGSLDHLNLLDTVYEDYQRLTSSVYGPGKRISYNDRLRLQNFLDQLDETDKRVAERVKSCSLPSGAVGEDTIPSRVSFARDWEALKDFYREYLNVIMLGVQCGRSRIFVYSTSSPSEYVGDWHQNIAHLHKEAEPQMHLVESNRFIAEHFVSELIKALDVEIGWDDGSTYLDQSLVMWQQEAGIYTHRWDGMPTLLAGKAGGYFNTGNYVDYRNLSKPFDRDNSGRALGIPSNRLLKECLLSMGVQAEEFAQEGMYGYGDPYQALFQGERPYPTQLIRDSDLSMPVIVS